MNRFQKGMIAAVAAAAIFTGCVRQTDYRKGLEGRKLGIDSMHAANSRKIDSLGKINRDFMERFMKGEIDSVEKKLPDVVARKMAVDSLQGANGELGKKKAAIDEKLAKLPE